MENLINCNNSCWSISVRFLKTSTLKLIVLDFLCLRFQFLNRCLFALTAQSLISGKHNSFFENSSQQDMSSNRIKILKVSPFFLPLFLIISLKKLLLTALVTLKKAKNIPFSYERLIDVTRLYRNIFNGSLNALSQNLSKYRQI